MNIVKQKMKVWRIAFKESYRTGKFSFYESVKVADNAVDEFVKKFNLQLVENKEVLNG